MRKTWPDPLWFDSSERFRDWLELHHQSEPEAFVGLIKANASQSNMSWSEAVDQALCFGWIDGITRRIDDERYVIRFTPRRPGSNWSNVNIAKVADLEERGLMRPAGRAAFEARRDDRSGIYSFERDPAELPAEMESRFRSNAAAWTYFSARAPGYRRVAIHWVTTAKQESTRQRRFDQLFECSAQEVDLPQFRRIR